MESPIHNVVKVGRFIRWGQAVTVDQAKRLLEFLPLAAEEKVVEFECEDTPSTEALDIRVTSF